MHVDSIQPGKIAGLPRTLGHAAAATLRSLLPIARFRVPATVAIALALPLPALADPTPEEVKAVLNGDALFLEDVLKDLPTGTFKEIAANESLAGLVDDPKDTDDVLAGKLRKRSDLISGLSAAQLALLSGPAGKVLIRRFETCKGRQPRIHHIGWKPILTFEPKISDRPVSAGERAVRIPVYGNDLYPQCTKIGVQVDGTVPVSRFSPSEKLPYKSDIFYRYPPLDRPDTFNVILLEPYLDRLKTGDRVSVAVQVSNLYSSDSTTAQRRQSETQRVFTVWDVPTYRAVVLKSRIDPTDFTAFPVPDAEARGLFGPLIADNYFVVRVSVRNTDSEAKLISTGMIRASGTVMIEPKGEGESSFATPVMVGPHSLQQVYSFVTDEDVKDSRNVFFRGLEFLGSLAAGAQGLLNFGTQAGKNVAYLTGIVTPESKKLWPDRLPGYQRNLVNYAMPDLFKVPANSVIEPKVLFFSKRDIEAYVADPNLFLHSTAPIPGFAKSPIDRNTLKPSAFVIALRFDDLDLHFEKVFTVPAVTARDQVVALLAGTARQVALLREIQLWLSGSPAPLGSLSVDDYRAIDAALQSVNTSAAQLTDESTKKHVEATAKSLGMLRDGLKPGTSSAPEKSSPLAKDLYGDGASGLGRVSASSDQLQRISQRLNAGVDAELVSADVAQIDKTVSGSKELAQFYLSAAATLDAIKPDLQALAVALKVPPDGNGTTPAAIASINKALPSIDAQLAALKGAKPQSASLSLE